MKKYKSILMKVGIALFVAILIAGLNFNVQPTSNNDYTLTIGTPAMAAGTLDYTCDGIDDHVQLQAALDALPAGGGKLVILGGNYSLGATVTRAINNVTIEGMGTATYLSNNGVTAIFTAGGNNWTIRDLRTDAGGLAMGVTTGWIWENITVNATLYAYASQADLVASLTANPAQGNILYYNGTDWAALAPGTNGQLFETQGAGANPQWTSIGDAVYIAATDSPTAGKRLALASGGAVCDGSNDEVEINAALTAGHYVVLLPGNFVIDADVVVGDDDRLLASGVGVTVIDYNTATCIRASNASNVEIGGFTATGLAGDATYPAAVIINTNAASESGFYIHDIKATVTSGNGFEIYVGGDYTISDVLVERYYSEATAGYGFMHNGSGTNPTINNCLYSYCQSWYADSTNTNTWGTGWDFNEDVDLVLINVGCDNCVAAYSNEAGFHFEGSTKKYGCFLSNCYAIGNGTKPAGATYGCGYNISGGDVTLSDCYSTLNECGSTSMGAISMFGGDGTDIKVSNYTSDGDLGVGLYVYFTAGYGGLRWEGGCIRDSGSYGVYLERGSNLSVNGLEVVNPTGYTNLGNQIGHATYVLSNSYLNINFRGTVSSSLVKVQKTDHITMTGSCYATGSTCINLQDNTNLTIYSMDVVNATASSRGIYSTATTEANTIINGCRVYTAGDCIDFDDGDDCMFVNNRLISSGGYSIDIDNANVNRCLIQNNNWYGSNADPLTTNATTPRIASNIDKAGAWAWGDNVQ